METVVACLRVSEQGPKILLSEHLDGPAPVLVYRVADYTEAVAQLRAAGATDVRELEIPHGPCASVRTAEGQRFAVYELRASRRPDLLRRPLRRLSRAVSPGGQHPRTWRGRTIPIGPTVWLARSSGRPDAGPAGRRLAVGPVGAAGPVAVLARARHPRRRDRRDRGGGCRRCPSDRGQRSPATSRPSAGSMPPCSPTTPSSRRRSAPRWPGSPRSRSPTRFVSRSSSTRRSRAGSREPSSRCPPRRHDSPRPTSRRDGTPILAAPTRS